MVFEWRWNSSGSKCGTAILSGDNDDIDEEEEEEAEEDEDDNSELAMVRPVVVG